MILIKKYVTQEEQDCTLCAKASLNCGADNCTETGNRYIWIPEYIQDMIENCELDD